MTEDELKSLRRLIQDRELIDEQIEGLRASVQRTSPNLDGMPHGGQQRDIMAEYVARLEELQDRYLEMSGKITEEILSLSDEICRVCTQKQAKVVLYRYKDCKEWGTIADEMGYADERSVRRLHHRAIKRLFKNSPVMTSKNDLI